MENNILDEQLAYYRARAQEYDESIYQSGRYISDERTNEILEEFVVVMQTLSTMGPFEHILELACGTGIWTKELLKIGHVINALDASPEMLEINHTKVADERVHYRKVDLFMWEPEQHYNLVFSANWLSHVPPEIIDTFLSKVCRSIGTAGQLFIVDQYAPMRMDLHAAREGNGIYHVRTLSDGRKFSIVKVFYDPTALKKKLTQFGFDVVVQKTGNYFFFLSGIRSQKRTI